MSFICMPILSHCKLNEYIHADTKTLLTSRIKGIHCFSVIKTPQVSLLPVDLAYVRFTFCINTQIEC